MLDHVIVEKAGRVADVNCRFNFVPSEDPDLDPSLFQRDYCLLDFLLQLVLNGRRTNQLQVVLDLLL